MSDVIETLNKLVEQIEKRCHQHESFVQVHMLPDELAEELISAMKGEMEFTDRHYALYRDSFAGYQSLL